MIFHYNLLGTSRSKRGQFEDKVPLQWCRIAGNSGKALSDYTDDDFEYTSDDNYEPGNLENSDSEEELEETESDGHINRRQKNINNY